MTCSEGWVRVQLLLGPRQPPGRCRHRAAAEVAGADAGDGGRADGSSLDDAGVAQPADPAIALGGPQAPGAAAQAFPGGQCMTTVPWGATCAGSGPENNQLPGARIMDGS